MALMVLFLSIWTSSGLVLTSQHQSSLWWSHALSLSSSNNNLNCRPLCPTPGHFSPGAKISLESFTNDEHWVTLQCAGYCFSHCQSRFGSEGGGSWGVSPLAWLTGHCECIQHDQILEMIAGNRIGPNTDNNDSISIISTIIILCLSERNFLTMKTSWIMSSLRNNAYLFQKTNGALTTFLLDVSSKQP